MVESPQNPSLQELLDRIARLEAKLDKQTKSVEVLWDCEARLHKRLDEINHIHYERFCNVSERIIELEFAVFPKLTAYMEAIKRAIGIYPASAMNWSPLDQRSPVSPDKDVPSTNTTDDPSTS